MSPGAMLNILHLFGVVRTGFEPCKAWPVRFESVRLSHGEVTAGYFNHGLAVTDQGREAFLA
jgi:hypothetical protein